MLTAHLIESLNGLGWHEYPLDGWTFEKAIALWENYKRFLEDRLAGKGGPAAKYVFSTKEMDAYGEGYSTSYPVAQITGGRLQQLADSSQLAWPGAGGYGEGCLYDNHHFVYPNGTKGYSGGSSPFFWSDAVYVADAIQEKDGIPYAVLDDFAYYLGRPHELLVIAQQVIQCLKDARKAYDAEQAKKPENGLPAPAADYARKGIPSWLWWTLGAVGMLAVGTAGVVFWRRKRAAGMGAWEDIEEYASPWESIEEGRGSVPRCRREYDQADALARRYRKQPSFDCDSPEYLTKAVQAAWEGRCAASRRYMSKATCSVV